MKGDESKNLSGLWQIENSLLWVEMSQPSILARAKGLAEEGWAINILVVSAICTDFKDIKISRRCKAAGRSGR